MGTSTTSSAAPSTASVTFEVRDPKTKEVYFTGKQHTRQDGKSVLKETLYFDSAQKQVQKDTFAFEANTLRALAYSSSNAVTGEVSVVKATEPLSVEIQYRPSTQEKTGKSVVKSEKQAYLPSAAADLILQNWDSLIAGKAVKFELIIPQRLETIPFQLVKRESLTVDSEAREVFTLMPQNILIRMLAPHLEFQYDKNKNIRQAVYPSSLPINGSKDRMVEMVFKT